MKQKAYSYYLINPKQYRFTSSGKKTIVKLVEFTPTDQPNIINLAFGDLLPDNEMDDKAISDNGDMPKVFVTIIHIVIDFTTKYPFLKIFFSGSSPVRTKLYGRILKMYYNDFHRQFKITGLTQSGTEVVEIEYEPDSTHGWLAFFVERKM